MTFSSLPKLKSNFTHVEKFLLSENITPQQLSHEIQRLFPRIKKLKFEIEDLGNEIPQNASSLFDDMKKDIEILSKANSPTNEQEMILRDFSKMKARILLKIEQTKLANTQNLEKKLKSLLNPENNKEDDEFENINQLLNEDIDNNDSVNENIKKLSNKQLTKQFEAELENIGLRMDSQMQRATDRLLDFEKTLSSKVLSLNDFKSVRALEEALFQAGNVKNQIIQYNSRISTLENAMKQLNLRFNDNHQNENDLETSNPLSGLPDLGFKLTDVKNEIEQSQENQSKVINDLENSIEKCENRITEQENEVKSLLETANSLLSSLKETERNANTLMDLVSDTSLEFSSNQAKHSIQAFYAEFKSQQAAILNELTALRERLKQSSFDIPLFKKF